MKIRGRKGFTLVEIMIVVAIIGLLAAIAIPNFIKARERASKEAAYANLKQIDGAKQVWALDTGAATNSAVTWGNLCSDYLKRKPTTPGTYTVGAMNVDPSVAGIGGVTLSGGVT